MTHRHRQCEDVTGNMTRAQLRASSRYVDGLCAIVDWATREECGECGSVINAHRLWCSDKCRKRAAHRRHPKRGRDQMRRYRARRKATA